MKELNITFLVINIIIIITVGLMLMLTPYFTRKSLLFGVRIPDEQKTAPEVLVMKRKYCVLMGVFSLLILIGAIAQFIIKPDLTVLSSLYAPLIIIALQFAVYIPLWKKAKVLKNDKQWYVADIGSADTKLARSRQTFSELPWGWYIGSAILVIIAAVVGILLYDQLPDVLVTHWNAAMEPDGWSDKSIMTVLSLPLITLGTAAVVLVSNMFVWRMKLQVNQEDPALSYAQHRIYRRLFSHVLGIVTVIIVVMMLFMYGMVLELFLPSSTQLWAGMIVATIIMIALPTVFYIKVGQAGNKLKPKMLPEEALGYEKTFVPQPRAKASFQDDRFWILGMFYYNKEDPTLFVEDRFGTNAGFNYARPIAWIFVAMIAALTIATYVLTTIIFLSQL